MKIPLFFKLWFGFIALLVLCTWGLYAFGAVALIHLGPAGLGHALGAAVHSFNQAVAGH